MVLFAVNTGLRESVCKLQWEWEVTVPEVRRSVFVIPPEAYKTRRAHVVEPTDRMAVDLPRAIARVGRAEHRGEARMDCR